MSHILPNEYPIVTKTQSDLITQVLLRRCGTMLAGYNVLGAYHVQPLAEI